MNILLDTHIFLWWLSDDKKLSKEAKLLIADVNNLVFVSAVSAWEISIKKNAGKLEAPDTLTEAIYENNFEELPITVKHSENFLKLPNHHSDPFDRLLVAQAIAENLQLVTHDKLLRKYTDSVFVV